MPPLPHPLRLMLVALAGWMNQQQRDVIDYLQAENRVLREQLGPRRLRFTDAQRRRLAAKAKTLGRRVLRDIATIVTPDTLPAWHRSLITKRYDGSRRRGSGRPPVIAEIRALIVQMAFLERLTINSCRVTNGFGDDGAHAAGSGESSDGRQHTRKKDGQIALRAIVATSRNPQKTFAN